MERPYVYKPLLGNPKKVKNKRPREVLKNPLIPNDSGQFRFEVSENFCRHCSGRMYWQIRKQVKTKQLKKAYYYMKWQRCWDCSAIYMDEASKVMNKERPKKQPPKPKPLESKDYSWYINSKKWARRRKAYFVRYGNECVICSSKENVNLHHKTYIRLGCEEDADLVVLCGEHHEEFHQMHGKSTKNMIQATDLFIEYKKQEILEKAHWATLIH